MATSCSSGDGTSNSGNSSTGSTGSTAPMIEAEDIVRTGEFELWTGLNAMTTQAYTDLNDHPASARLEDATGVDVDYVSPAVGQENTQFNKEQPKDLT